MARCVTESRDRLLYLFQRSLLNFLLKCTREALIHFLNRLYCFRSFRNILLLVSVSSPLQIIIFTVRMNENRNPFVRHIQDSGRRRNIIKADFISLECSSISSLPPFSSFFAYLFTQERTLLSSTLAYPFSIANSLILAPYTRAESKGILFLSFSLFPSLAFSSLLYIFLSGWDGKKIVVTVRYRIYTRNLGWISRFCVNLQRSLEGPVVLAGCSEMEHVILKLYVWTQEVHDCSGRR